MDQLRVILIIIGLILLAVIYALGRRDERRAQEKRARLQTFRPRTGGFEVGVDPDPDQYEDPQEDARYDRFDVSRIDESDSVFLKRPIRKAAASRHAAESGYSAVSPDGEEAFLASESDPVPQTVKLPAGVEPLLVHLTVIAPRDMKFDPHYLKQTLEDCGLIYGNMKIYHYYRGPKSDREFNRGQRLFSVANLMEPGYFDPRDINTYRTPGLALFLQLPGPIDGVLAFEKMHQMGEMLAKRLSGVLCDDKRNKITPQSITHIKDEISEYHLKLRTRLLRTVH